MLTSDTDASLKWCSTPPLWHIDAVGRGVHPIINDRQVLSRGCVAPQQVGRSGACRHYLSGRRAFDALRKRTSPLRQNERAPSRPAFGKVCSFARNVVPPGLYYRNRNSFLRPARKHCTDFCPTSAAPLKSPQLTRPAKWLHRYPKAMFSFDLAPADVPSAEVYHVGTIFRRATMLDGAPAQCAFRYSTSPGMH
jgi:hypothetical protein